MAFVLNDRVKQTSTSTGTGTINLSATAETGFETFVAGIGTTNSTFYCISHDGTSEFEVGIGTVSDNKVDFSAGTKTVFCTYPAKRAPSASMTASTYVNTHSATISDTQTMESGVLAGPVTVSGNVTVTGTLVII